MSLLMKVGEGIAKKKVGVKTFHAAYKKAPGETLGTYAKKHRWGIGLTAATMAAPSPFQSRRSTHQGIDQKD